MSKIVVLSFFILNMLQLFGQKNDVLIADDFKRFGFILENDVFNRTDHYYTNGVMLNFSHPGFSNSFLFGLFSTPKTDQYDRYGIGFEHKMYTAIDKNNLENLESDRPFSSYFLVNMHKETRKGKSKSSNYFQIGIGLLGIDAGGEELQNLIHEILPGNEPVLGWDNQIKNEFLFDIKYVYEKGVIHSKYFDFMAFANVQAGTLKDNLGLGTKLRFGWMPNYYTQNIGKGRSFGDGIYVFSEILWNSRWVAYDASLQGGKLYRQDNIFVILPNEVEDFVHEVNISLNFRYKKYQLSFMQTFLSPEFNGGLSHKYGGANLIIEF